MNLLQTEAIVLQTLPFKEYDKILTLFSPQGILKFFAKGSKKNHIHLTALTSPLTRAEYHYSTGKKELHRLSDGTILSQHLRLRDRYETLLAAEKMVKALLQSQWPGKPAPKLFQLFALFLEYLPELHNPSYLSTAFLLKILKHEGVLQLSAPLAPTIRFAGEIYPENEAPPGALFFSEEEEGELTLLALCRSLSQFSSEKISVEFQNKIEKLFFQAFNK